MDPVEPAIAEHGYDIVLLQHRRNTLNDRVGILLVEREPARAFDFFHHALGIQSFRFRDLFEPRDLRNENAVGNLQRIRQLVLKNRASSGV